MRSGAYSSISGADDTSSFLQQPSKSQAVLRQPDSPEMLDDEEEGFAILSDETWFSWLRNQGRRRILFAAAAVFFICLVIFIMGLIALTTGDKGVIPDSRLPYTEDTEGLFYASSPTISWFHGGEDGNYIEKDEKNNIVLKHVEFPNTTVLARNADLIDSTGASLSYFTYSVSPDMALILLGTRYHKGWRHSFFADYWLFNTRSRKTFLLTTSKTGKEGQADEPGMGQVPLIKWSSTGHNLAYVRDNDIYMLVNGTQEMRFTVDGSANILNGFADWVYEEEVYGSADAIWFSPDGLRVAYVKFNDTLVPEYPLLYNVQDHNGEPVGAYPHEVRLKYPKPGYPNPSVTIHVADSTLSKSIPVTFEPGSLPSDDDLLVTEIDWACPSSCFLIRVTNRVQDRMQVYNASFITKSRSWQATLVRDDKSPDGAWFPQLQPTTVLPILESGSPKNGTPFAYYSCYLELRDHAGWMHIGLYNVSSKSAGRAVESWLTSGSFDVVSISAVDLKLGIVYFISTEEGPTQRHLYSVSIDGKTKVKINPPSDMPASVMTHVHSISSTAGYYGTRFSPGSRYYVLSYEGPDVPWTRVMRNDGEVISALTDNQNVREAYEKYSTPSRDYISIPNEDAGIDMNAVLVYPPNFNPNQVYPLLVRCYGGPASQLAAMKYTLDFSNTIASHGFIVASVDGRGTDFMGRDYRNSVSGKLGELEAFDQIVAGRYLKDLSYISDNQTAIWGWSYGGYLTSKVIEANSGVFQVGMAVAPVTDWLLYDSVYTERYMKTPTINPEGYKKSAVRNMTGFKNAKFLLVHGSADDNVHFQNSLRLLWLLTEEHVVTYTSQVFTDSDHSVSTGQAYNELMGLLKSFLFQNLGIAP
ncbi:hypothetical protein SmJEL517_g00090 [Synchytrium microbalum]|uniref:Dipeptidyl-peptidase IV n=1 Tax=Synchytrium microbalum TaxID=1806994 RepID=A0A507CJ55_9FUNG|nr:uncharacterized protein SmJEL517_g00090 [Synchytrium microbalum]TPX38296.1 hypothetical protein SmJEL517_g00090 [Synchytrium microbalum]